MLGGKSEGVVMLTILMQTGREAAMKNLLAKQTAKSKHPSQPTQHIGKSLKRIRSKSKQLLLKNSRRTISRVVLM